MAIYLHTRVQFSLWEVAQIWPCKILAKIRSCTKPLNYTLQRKVSVYKRCPTLTFLHSAIPSDRLHIYKVIPFLIISIILILAVCRKFLRMDRIIFNSLSLSCLKVDRSILYFVWKNHILLMFLHMFHSILN